MRSARVVLAGFILLGATLSGCTRGGVHGSHSAGIIGIPTHIPAFSPEPAAVPFEPLVAPPTPKPKPAIPEHAPVCGLADLHVEQSELGPAMGNIVGALTFRDRGPQACIVPRVRLLSIRAAGVRKAEARRLSLSHSPGLVLTHGRSAIIREAFGSWCGPKSGGEAQIALSLELGHQAFRVRTRSAIPSCKMGHPKAAFDMGEVQYLHKPRPKVPAPGPVNLGVSAPSWAMAGSNLDYQVNITNHSSNPFAFHPCPLFQESLASRGGWQVSSTYRLNCSKRPLGRLGGEHTYSMVLQIPKEAPIGPMTLTWQLDPQYAKYREEPHAKTTLFMIQRTLGMNPFAEASKVSLDVAKQRAGYPLIRPQDPLASDANLIAVWIEPPGPFDNRPRPSAALEYSSGLVAILSPGSQSAGDSDQAFAQYFTRQAASLQGASEIEMKGSPALIVPGDPRLPGDSGWVSLYRDTVQISIYGPLSGALLTRIAQSVR